MVLFASFTLHRLSVVFFMLAFKLRPFIMTTFTLFAPFPETLLTSLARPVALFLLRGVLPHAFVLPCLECPNPHDPVTPISFYPTPWYFLTTQEPRLLPKSCVTSLE